MMSTQTHETIPSWKSKERPWNHMASILATNMIKDIETVP